MKIAQRSHTRRSRFSKRSRWEKQLHHAVAFSVSVLMIGCLYWARAIFIPFTLAVLFTFLLSPPLTFLQRRGLPKIPAVVIVVIAAVLFLGGIGWLVGSQMNSLANRLPHYQENVAQKIRALREQSSDSFIGKVNRFITRMTAVASAPTNAETGESGPNSPPPAVRVVNTEDYWNPLSYVAVLMPTLEPITSAGLVFVFVVFMLIDREDLRNRLLSLVGHGHLTLTTKAFDEGANRISRYLSAQFAINVGYGALVMCGLLLAGVPFAVVWGFFAACFRYIPLIGPWIAMCFPLTLSLLVSEGWFQPLSVVLLWVGCELLANLVFDPWMYGKTIGVSQTALMVAIAFWTWLWGAIGLITAAPLTVWLVVVGKFVPQLKFLDLLLGDEPTLTPELQFYQRLIARDPEEAMAILQQHAAEHAPEHIYDRFLISTLVHAKQDYAADQLTQADIEFVSDAAERIGENAFTAEFYEQASAGVRANNAESTTQVLLCAARDHLDEVAAEMFRQLIESRFQVEEIATSNLLASEMIRQVEQSACSIIGIVALPPEGLSQARLITKRLRARFPDLKIIVARWGLGDEFKAEEALLLAAGATAVSSDIETTLGQVRQLVQLLPSTSEEHSSPPLLNVVRPPNRQTTHH